jgi:K+-transporting ATPase ATPase A chain
MTTHGWLQIVLFFIALVALAKPLGLYMARVYGGQPTFLTRPLGPIEALIYRLGGVRSAGEMTWQT